MSRVIGIIGCRERNTGDDLKAVEKAFLTLQDADTEIVSGGCPLGGDRFAEFLAKKYQVPIKIYYAQWNKFGDKAGFERNGKIAEDADYLIACVAPDRKGGTEDTITKFTGDNEALYLELGRLILV